MYLAKWLCEEKDKNTGTGLGKQMDDAYPGLHARGDRTNN
jgi:hypothetical protein